MPFWPLLLDTFDQYSNRPHKKHGKAYNCDCCVLIVASTVALQLWLDTLCFSCFKSGSPVYSSVLRTGCGHLELEVSIV